MRKRQTTSTTTQIQTEQLQLLTIPEVAKYLAVGRTTVYKLINVGELKTVKVLDATRISAAALQRFIAAKQAS